MRKPIKSYLPSIPKILGYIISVCIASQCIPNLYAKDFSAPITQTKNQLKKLDSQIITLQRVLNKANNKRAALHKELENTEKKIGAGIRKRHQLQQEMKENQKQINTLKIQSDELKQEFKTQQTLLAKHLRAGYQMGTYQPLKWLLNQDNPYEINRLLTYYQYIISSRQLLIEKIALMKSRLKQNRLKLQTGFKLKQQMQAKLNEQEQKLLEDKNYHLALIKALNNDIQGNQEALNEFKRNKQALTMLLKSLAKQSTEQAQRPFKQMYKKLPRPVSGNQLSFQKMNQGVTFFVKEGAHVNAVYPGKVVFSDWLKGYGLLLIIDHGQGYMTLYAHNESLFKRKGESVYQNEQIANAGHTGGIKKNGLYFEVRHHGKAVPPLEWLS